MLTQNDLQAITKIIEPIRQDVSGLKQYISSLKEDVSTLKKDVTDLKKDMQVVKKDIKKIIQNQNDDFDYMDRTGLHHEQRLKHIENHLGLPHT